MKQTITIKTLVCAAAVAAALGSAFPIAEAVNLPQAQATDGRIRVVNYSPENVVPIAGHTFITTQIQFGQDESIENVQNGDTAAWEASINKDLPYMLFIKPTAFASHTNMTVVTDKHTYYFALSSNAQDDDKAPVTYALKFAYPHEALQRQLQAVRRQKQSDAGMLTAAQHPGDYNWDYTFSGDMSIAPLHVFNDARFTYFQLQPNAPVPAVFVVDNPDGHESVVNYRQDGNYLVVDRVAPQFTLRLGKDHVASVFNERAIAELQGRPMVYNVPSRQIPPLAAAPVATTNATPSAVPIATQSGDKQNTAQASIQTGAASGSKTTQPILSKSDRPQPQRATQEDAHE